MPSPDLTGGLPRPWLEAYDNKNALQTRYGNFAIAILQELKGDNPDFPMDILTVGDNWYQLAECRDYPNNEAEEEMAKLGYSIFGDMWPIMDRQENMTVREFLVSISQGVRACSLDDRILEKIAILDRTSIANPAFEESQVVRSKSQPWGRIAQLRGIKTEIYHITSGFTRKLPEDLGGTKPSDDFSATIFWNE